jgi:hypothetical protein
VFLFSSYLIGCQKISFILRLSNIEKIITEYLLLVHPGKYLDRGHGSHCPERHIFKDLEGRKFLFCTLHTDTTYANDLATYFLNDCVQI